MTSDGSKFNNPRHLAKHQQNLKRKQQKLSRKQKAIQCGLGGSPHERLNQEGFEIFGRTSQRYCRAYRNRPKRLGRVRPLDC